MKWLLFLPMWSVPVYLLCWPYVKEPLGDHLSSYLFGIIFIVGICSVSIGVAFDIISEYESAAFGLGLPVLIWILMVILKNLILIGSR